ncbi:MAG: glucosidase [Chlamydiia bacterium]|nr:glucosidase [Chlamydiia bacterium]
MELTAEGRRLVEARGDIKKWRKWGPYLSERQWGTVREDYSKDGDAWNYFPYEHARSRAYRWGEDGLMGLSDKKHHVCFSIALWNGKDTHLKERLFGLSGPEGNHGEDVKEYYFYLDNLPSHAYMKALYKYPQKAFPYEDLLKTNQSRTREEPEYELLDTGIFDDDEYFDVFIEYAKETDENIYILITAHNRGDKTAPLTLLPTVWFRNTWAWDKESPKPHLSLKDDDTILIDHPAFSNLTLVKEESGEAIFTENETNEKKLFGKENKTPYVIDAFHDYVVDGKKDAVNPKKTGTKGAFLFQADIPAKSSKTFKLKLGKNFKEPFDALFEKRMQEAEEFYLTITPYDLPKDLRNIQRQAFASLLWNKQFYHYNVSKWLEGNPEETPPESRRDGRNSKWPYFDASEIFSMPDNWEYPWFAAWDTAFHMIPMAMIDPDFAKKQLIILTKEWYMSPDGQIPAYEWNFSDVNPPVHAWAAMRIFQIEKLMYGREDRGFLEKIFLKLSLNFTWWVNRKDSEGRNIFQGGFLGLDNVGAFDRSMSPPEGGILEQPDATGWMAMYCLNCLEIALELAVEDPVYEDMATKFFEHFVYIADAIDNITEEKGGLWDEEEGFYYSMLIHPNGETERIKQDNMAGIVPLFAVQTNRDSIPRDLPEYGKRFRWFVENRKEMLNHVAAMNKTGDNEQILLSLADDKKLKRIFEKLLDENQFLSPHGIRSVSKRLKKEPFHIHLGGKEFTLDYEPAESTTPLFGGNSNWRGPVWFPLNYLLFESLQKFDYYYGDKFLVEFPAGSGKKASLWEVSLELSRRLATLFLKDKDGKRPIYANRKKFQDDPHWKDYILFFEYFNGDTGEGLGASHQAGWTAIIAKLIHQYGKYAIEHTPHRELEEEKVGRI